MESESRETRIQAFTDHIQKFLTEHLNTDKKKQRDYGGDIDFIRGREEELITLLNSGEKVHALNLVDRDYGPGVVFVFEVGNVGLEIKGNLARRLYEEVS